MVWPQLVIPSLFDGDWASVEGQIWENYDPNIHVIDGELTKSKTTGRWWINTSDPKRLTVELTWFFASVDWGYRNAGCLLVFGVDRDGVAYMVHEITDDVILRGPGNLLHLEQDFLAKRTQ